MTSAALSRAVRKVDTGSQEHCELERDESQHQWFQVACTPEVVLRWHKVRNVARRVHGGRVGSAECVEMTTAEVLSALPLAPEASWDTDDDGVDKSEGANEPPVAAGVRDTALLVRDDAAVHEEPAGLSIPAAIDGLLCDGENVDAFELHRRLRAALEIERQLDAQMGPRLELLMRRRVYWLLGYTNREAYVRERLGLDPSWGRTLLRIERAARASPTFSVAYRDGRLSALQAATLVPLVFAELDERRMALWIERATAVSLRQLRDDVDVAVTVRESCAAGCCAPCTRDSSGSLVGPPTGFASSCRSGSTPRGTDCLPPSTVRGDGDNRGSSTDRRGRSCGAPPSPRGDTELAPVS